jgi:hypothetical protein
VKIGADLLIPWHEKKKIAKYVENQAQYIKSN